ncbi:hypothetical protein TRVA0_059S00430 [Trichomonascus vanleenenianus]|uniref:uncharacterized protein n=1 Tax=Trichomonascus vanleenenianus TaxID=2268995 RepID=UPI003EC9D6EA
MKRTRAILKEDEDDNRAPKRSVSESLAARRKAIEEKYKTKTDEPSKNRKFGALMGQTSGGGILQRRRMTEEERIERRKKLEERVQARKDGETPQVNQEMEKLRQDAQQKRMAQARARLLRTRRIKGIRISFQPAFLTKDQEAVIEEQIRELERGEFEYSEDEHESAKEYSRSPSPSSYREVAPVEGDYYRPGRDRGRERRRRSYSPSRSSSHSRYSSRSRGSSWSKSPRSYDSRSSSRSRGRRRSRSYSRSPRRRSYSRGSRRSYSMDSRVSRDSRDSRSRDSRRYSRDSRDSGSRDSRRYSRDSRRSSRDSRRSNDSPPTGRPRSRSLSKSRSPVPEKEQPSAVW